MISISIITPVWNGERFIQETLTSIYSQSHPCLEHIIMDALSKDRTPEIIARNATPATRHVREKDKGLYDAMNKGIALAKGDVVGIINADDKLTDGALEMVAKIFSDATVDYVFSDAVLLNEAGDTIGTGHPLEFEKTPPIWPLGFDWRFYTPYNHPTLFVRRTVYERYGSFDTSFRLAADHELMARFIANGLKGVKAPAPLAEFRLGGLSSGSASIFKEDEAIAVRYGMPRWLARLNRVKCTLGRWKETHLGRKAS